MEDLRYERAISAFGGMAVCALATIVLSVLSLGSGLLPESVGTVADYAAGLVGAVLLVVQAVLIHRLVAFSPNRKWIRAAVSARTFFIAAPSCLTLALILTVTATCIGSLWRGALVLVFLGGILAIVGGLAPAFAYWNTLNVTRILGTWSRDRRLQRWSAWGRALLLIMIALGIALVAVAEAQGPESPWSDVADLVIHLASIAWTGVTFFVYRLAIGSLRRTAAQRAAGPPAPPPAVQAAIDAARLMGQMRHRDENPPPGEQDPPAPDA